MGETPGDEDVPEASPPPGAVGAEVEVPADCVADVAGAGRWCTPSLPAQRGRRWRPSRRYASCWNSSISGYPMIARCDRTSVEALHAGDAGIAELSWERGRSGGSLDWDRPDGRAREALAMTNSLGRSRRVVPMAAAALGALACLSACSGAGAGADTAARAAAQSLAPAGPCQKAQFAAHSGLAAGAIQNYVGSRRRPEPSSRARTTEPLPSTRRGGPALSRLDELAAASPLVAGCPWGHPAGQRTGNGQRPLPPRRRSSSPPGNR